MLPQSWLLTILVPIALGAPVSRESEPPTLTLMANMSDVKSGSLLKSEMHRAGSPALDRYPPHGSGLSCSETTDSTSYTGHKMGLDKANTHDLKQDKNRGNTTSSYGGSPSLNTSALGGTGVSSTGALDGTSGGTIGGASDGHSGGASFHGSGSIKDSKDMATGSECTTTGNGSGMKNGSKKNIATGNEGTTTGSGSGSGVITDSVNSFNGTGNTSSEKNDYKQGGHKYQQRNHDQ